MTGNTNPAVSAYADHIRKSGRTIYDPIEVGDPNLWVPTPALESLLNNALAGLNLAGLPNRTRSKVVKTAVCKALGYPVPASFAKDETAIPRPDVRYLHPKKQQSSSLERRVNANEALCYHPAVP